MTSIKYSYKILPHFLSSLPSPQLSTPSQTKSWLRQTWLSQVNVLPSQSGYSEKNKNNLNKEKIFFHFESIRNKTWNIFAEISKFCLWAFTPLTVFMPETISFTIFISFKRIKRWHSNSIKTLHWHVRNINNSQIRILGSFPQNFFLWQVMAKQT